MVHNNKPQEKISNILDINIWTDGAYKSTTDQGGWAYVIDDMTYDFNGVKNTTNNRMELTAVIEAIKYFHKNKFKKCTIYSDSQYVINTINRGWKRNKNQDLWKIFDELNIGNIAYVWVKGHDNDLMNNKADELAVRGSELLII